MKKLLIPIILSLSVVFILSCNKESASVKVKKENLETAKKRDIEISKGAAEIKFDITEYDFGTVNEGQIVEAKYTVTNAGKTDLIISNVQASCGCTVPTWPKEPIAPGASGTIKVKYDTKRPGPINKSVTITSNAVNTPTKVLRIKGEVGQAPKSGAPVNNAGAPAKQ